MYGCVAVAVAETLAVAVSVAETVAVAEINPSTVNPPTIRDRLRELVQLRQKHFSENHFFGGYF